MLTPTLPWWELVLRGAVIYLVLLVMVRLSGRRTIGQFTPFDLLVVLLLSESVSNALAGGDESLGAGLIVAATLVVLNAVVGLAATHSRTIEKAVEGDFVMIGRDGELLKHVMSRHRVSEAEVNEALRRADCDLQDMRFIVLEANGELCVMEKKARP